jgi:hypothetical protein
MTESAAPAPPAPVVKPEDKAANAGPEDTAATAAKSATAASIAPVGGAAPGAPIPDGAAVAASKGKLSGESTSAAPDPERAKTLALEEQAKADAPTPAVIDKKDAAEDTPSPATIKADLQKSVTDQLENALAFGNKALDMACGDAEVTISDEEAVGASMFLAYVPSTYAEKIATNIGSILDKQAGTILTTLDDDAKRGLALGVFALEAHLG